MRKPLLFLLSVAMSALTAWADGPYRNYRYDGYKVLRPTSESIVFIGNSITDMHNWAEAFDNPNVIERGVSGAVASELIDNLEAILPGHPKKIFMMIGTNDLGSAGLNTPEKVAAKIRTALTRCKKESPNTELYVQSILPSKSGIRVLEDEIATNDSIKKLCEEFGATYVDLWDKMQGTLDGSITLDGLHLKASGYRIWCKEIAKYVGSECVYQDSYTDITGGLGGAHGMRCTYFGMAPVKATDVLIIGDGTINGAEWSELLHNPNVKRRATGWGGAGTDMNTITSMLPAIFTGNGNKVAPKQILLEFGYQEATQKIDADSIARKYKIFLDKVRSYAPTTPIKIMAVYPSNTADINTSYIVPLNTNLKAMTDTIENVDFIEGTYTELVKNGVANTDYFNSYYVYGRGYAKLSQVLAPHIEGSTPITDEEANARIATFNARTTLTKAINTAEALSEGNGVGQYKTEDLAEVKAGIEEGYALLAKDGVTDEEFTTKGTTYTTLINNVLPKINLPENSRKGESHWYQLSTPNRNNRYTTSQGAGNQLIGGDKTALTSTMWKFSKREDGTYDIINRADGSYINPVAEYNKPITTVAEQPEKGWTLSHSNSPSTFNIACGTVELNQTNLNNAIYNWSNGNTGQDRNDQGCQFAINDAPLPLYIQDLGDFEISSEKGAFANPSSGFNKLWTSTDKNPEFTLSCDANNMTYDGTNVKIFSGTKKTSTYNITVPDSFIITGIKFDCVNAGASDAAKTITCNSKSVTTSATETAFVVDNLQATTASLVLAGDNTGVILKNFTITVKKLSDKRADGGVDPGEEVNPNEPVTGINQVAIAGKGHEAIFDLQGRRVNKVGKGVFIINGKKVVK